MFNTAQTDYIKSLVATMRGQGYEYYIAYSDFDREDSKSPDLYIIFSNENINATGLYTFDIPENSVRYTVNSSNYSSYQNNSARVAVSDFTASSLSVDRFEHIYTNAEYLGHTVQPDISKGNEVQLNATLQACCLIVSCALLFSIIFTWFKR